MKHESVRYRCYRPELSLYLWLWQPKLLIFGIISECLSSLLPTSSLCWGFCTTEVVSKESWKLILSFLFWVTLLITVNGERYGHACMVAIFELAWCGNSAAVKQCLYIISYYYDVQLKRQGWNFISEAIVRSNPSGSNLSCFICLSI